MLLIVIGRLTKGGALDNRDRVDVVGDWRSGVPARLNPFAAVPWFNPRAFAAAAAGTFGNIGRNALRGPGFGSVDFSIFKETPITERIRTQLRVEIFNIFNRANFANPGNNLNAPASFGLITNTRNAVVGTPDEELIWYCVPTSLSMAPGFDGNIDAILWAAAI